MGLRIFTGDDDSEPTRHDSSDDAAATDVTGTLSLTGAKQYFVFAAYGSDYADMRDWKSRWQRSLPGQHRFWPGFSGGGVLAVPRSEPIREQTQKVFGGIVAPNCKSVYGLVLGNAAGKVIAESITAVTPERAPDIAVKWGLAERVPNTTVTATTEHADCLRDERYLIAVPKTKRKSLKLLEQVPNWFETFGVKVVSGPAAPPDNLCEEMRDWFDDPGRLMYAFRLEGGEPNAAWQLAVTYYIAEYWDVHARGLDSVHFVANIQGKPCFRRNWTSNR